MLDFIEDNSTSAESFQADNFFSSQEFEASNLMDACAFILIRLNAPEPVRRLFPVLLGMLAGRSYRVRFTRLHIGRRLFATKTGHITGDIEEAERKRIEQRISDILGVMQDWIHREGISNLVRYEPGTKTDPCHIQTPLLKWMIEVSQAAGQRLSPDDSDHRRRVVFTEEVKHLFEQKRVKTERRTDKRPKRQVDPHAQLKTAKTLIKNYFNSAKVGNDEESLRAFILREIAGCLDRIPQELDMENCGKEEISGTQGGDCPDPGYQDFDATSGTCNVKFLTGTDTEPGREVREIPPCVPCLPDALISDGAKSLMAITSGRPGDHWSAVNLAASVGAVPVWILVGGRGDVGLETHGQEVREVESMPDFITGFDEQLIYAADSQRSLVLTLSPCVFHRDDCTLADVDRLRPYGWMVTQTSPDSYQVWFRLVDSESGEEGRRQFHDILTAAGIGGNPGGTHSGRWPGGINGKAHHQGWRVRLAGGQAGRVVTLGEMVQHFAPLTSSVPRDERSGMVRDSKSGFRGKFPDYDKCLVGRRSRSEADASFITLAFDRGFDAGEIFTGLVSVSQRAASMPERAVKADIDRIGRKYGHR